MTYRLLFPQSYLRRARKFLKKHPEIIGQYQKTLELLEINPHHPSLSLHRLQGELSELSSVSINMSYRILLQIAIRDKDIIFVDIGSHEQVY